MENIYQTSVASIYIPVLVRSRLTFLTLPAVHVVVDLRRRPSGLYLRD